MMKMAEARRMALSLPEATEEDHFGIPSFRVKKKIFATVPGDKTIRIMLGPEETSAATSTNPRAFEELWWGKQLAGITVHLAQADKRQVADLLFEAWRRKAPKTLVKAFQSTRAPKRARV